MSKPPFFAERQKITKSQNDDLEKERDLPPIVARMVVEIRSDGSRTVARGALEDLQNGERVALEADAASPVALGAQLTKALVQMPSMARSLTETAARDMAEAQLNKLKEKWESLSELSPFKKKKKDPRDG